MFLLQRDRIMLLLSLEAIKAHRIHITPHVTNMPLVAGEWSASRCISENITNGAATQRGSWPPYS